jgi:hypothetical protein
MKIKKKLLFSDFTENELTKATHFWEPQLPKAHNLGDLMTPKNPEAPDSEI